MLRVPVEAHPNASVSRVELVDDTLRVWVRARPIDGKANAAIAATIAEALGLRDRQVRLASGTRSRQKMFEIDLPDWQELRARLARFNRA